MAKINNSAVIQKLVDELRLYPSKDVIPTELAEKVLPVFQINSEEIIVKTPTANIVRSLSSYSGSGTTLYTTPATGKFFLTNVAMSSTRTGINEQIPNVAITVIGDVSSRAILSFSLQDDNQTLSNSLNLQNPVQLEPGSNIAVVGSSDGSAETNVVIVGYTE